jgi:hypothetical protein
MRMDEAKLQIDSLTNRLNTEIQTSHLAQQQYQKALSEKEDLMKEMREMEDRLKDEVKKQVDKVKELMKENGQKDNEVVDLKFKLSSLQTQMDY